MNLRKNPLPKNRTHYLFNRRKTNIEKDKSTSRHYKKFQYAIDLNTESTSRDRRHTIIR